MDIVLENESVYENISIKFDPGYKYIHEFIEVVQNFIRERKLIIYGGLAIDFALRLHGDKIYDDSQLQVDYDFLSPNSIEDSYVLADKFYKIDPNDSIRAINALHVKTMRVDIGDNHFLADISYTPEVIFKQMPHLEYNGLRFIHPDMQRIDIHSSLAFPYDNAPFEVVLHRWKKDVKRFNLLAKYYPITCEKLLPVNGRYRTELKNIRNKVLSGFSAYGVYCKLLNTQTNIKSPDIINGFFHIDKDNAKSIIVETDNVKTYIVETYGYNLDIIDYDLSQYTTSEHYHNFINLVPERVNSGNIHVQSTEDRLVSIQEVTIDGVKLTLVSIQYLLKYFLGFYYYCKMNGSPKLTYDADTYLAHYVSTVNMLNASKSKLTGLSHRVYGENNDSLSKKIAIDRIKSELGKPSKYQLPKNYYPARGKSRPEFDIQGNPIYMDSGEPM